jgi:hypothetical protein
MAMSVTLTPDGIGTDRRFTFDWGSAADGTFSGTLTERVRGMIMRVDFIPNQGATQPTDDYDITCEDDKGIDVFQGRGTDCPNDANSTRVPAAILNETSGLYPSAMPVYVDSTLELKGSGCGDSKTGTVVIYLD